jgi:hypothetical protein
MVTDNFQNVTVADYRRLLPGCVRESRSAKETEGQSLIKRMLLAHYESPDRMLTAGELATKVNLRNFGEVNLKYGKFASLLCGHVRAPRPQARVLCLRTTDFRRETS